MCWTLVDHASSAGSTGALHPKTDTLVGVDSEWAFGYDFTDYAGRRTSTSTNAAVGSASRALVHMHTSGDAHAEGTMRDNEGPEAGGQETPGGPEGPELT